MRLRILGLALCIGVGSCVQTATLETPFRVEEHAFAINPGTATVVGQAFLRRNDGVVVYGAGSKVLLISVTSYTLEMANRAANAPFGIQLTNLDARLVQYVKQTQADGEGRFTFAGIPDGMYMVSAMVTWMAGDAPQGGEVRANINIIGGKDAINVILTR